MTTHDPLREAIEFLSPLFADDEPVDGADLVEWAAEWLPRAQAVFKHPQPGQAEKALGDCEV